MDRGDAALYQEIRLEALEGHLESFGARLEDESSKALDEVGQRLDRSAVFGVFDGDVLAGVAGWYAMPGAKQAHRGALWGMYVRPGHRHRGIGKMLVDQVIDDATVRHTHRRIASLPIGDLL